MIPVLNEEASIAKVIRELPVKKYKLDVIVCDNGSTDSTVSKAQEAGGRVVFEKQRGYGAACLKALKIFLLILQLLPLLMVTIQIILKK